MNIYDPLIDQVQSIFFDEEESLPLQDALCGSCVGIHALKEGNSREILLKSDTAFELGAYPYPCVSTLAVTSSRGMKNKIRVKGRDLTQINSDTAFGKAVFLRIEEIFDEQKLFDIVKELESVKYKYVPSGFMVRASAINMREQIRVGKEAVRAGYTFVDYARFLMKKYLEFPFVKSCAVYLSTDEDTVKKLSGPSFKIYQATRALNHILDNVLADCGTCKFKSVCDELEGFKKIHMSRRGK